MLSEQQKQRIAEFEAPEKVDVRQPNSVPSMNAALLAAEDELENRAFRKLLLDPPENPQELNGLRFMILATDGVEELELTVPYKFVQERGGTVHLVTTAYEEQPAKMGLVYPKEKRQTHIMTARFMENAGWFRFDRTIDEVQPEDYDALIIAGGAWNPDALRTSPKVLEFVRNFFDSGKPTAAICHAPWVLISAGVMKGKRATGNWAIFDDLRNAGADVTDETVVVDDNLITSRYPYDLPEFLTQTVNAINKRNAATA